MEEVARILMKISSELDVEPTVQIVKQMSETGRDQLLRDFIVMTRVAYEFVSGPRVWQLHGAGQVGHDLGLLLESIGQHPLQLSGEGRE